MCLFFFWLIDCIQVFIKPREMRMLAGFKSPHSFPHVRPHTIILVWSGTCGKVISRGDPIQAEFAYSSLLNLVLTRPVALVASKSIYLLTYKCKILFIPDRDTGVIFKWWRYCTHTDLAQPKPCWINTYYRLTLILSQHKIILISWAQLTD